jgi:Ran GTPase-activating protein (RanGAP) involved in mRNA processing and transport
LRGKHFLARFEKHRLEELLKTMGIEETEYVDAILEAVDRAQEALFDTSDEAKHAALIKRLHFQTTLVASNNPLYATLRLSREDIGDEGIQLVVEALRANDIIHTLDLSQNGIEDAGSKDLESLLRTNKTITKLDISGNTLGPMGAERIGDCFCPDSAHTVNKTVTSLNLRCVNARERGARKVAHALTYNKNMRRHCSLLHVDLWGNGIGVEGAYVMSKMLPLNYTLTVLDLSCNMMYEEGVEVIAKSLKENYSLTHLNLSDNWEGADGFRSIARALPLNSTLTSLGLAANSGGLEGVKALVDVLGAHRSLTHLNLIDNQVEEKSAEVRTEIRSTCSPSQTQRIDPC